MAKQNIKWVIAHEPIDLFLRAAKKFSDEINSKTDKFSFECLTLKEYSDKYNGGVQINKYDLLDHMDQGKVEMAQMYTTTLGQKHNRDMWALDMPFLFKDHDHAARVLDGQIGQKILSEMTNEGNVRGLAFTYSGGFRMLPSDRDINVLSDLQGMRVRVHEHSPVASETFKAVGAEPVQLMLEEINEGVAKDMIDAGESTYPRYYSLKQNEALPTINDTQHSLFLTSVLINDNFWAEMDAADQEVIQSAALSAAVTERAESIADIKKVEEVCAKDGININKMSESVTAEWKAATAHLYDKFEDMFTPGLLKAIQKA